MSRVLRRPQAAEDIAEAWDYIAEDNLEAADRWVDRLDEQFRLLATQPLMAALATNSRQAFAAFRSAGTSSFTRRSMTASTWCGYYTRHVTSTPSSTSRLNRSVPGQFFGAPNEP